MDEAKTTIDILKIIYVDNRAPKEKLRTKEWLLKINQMMDLSSGKE